MSPPLRSFTRSRRHPPTRPRASPPAAATPAPVAAPAEAQPKLPPVVIEQKAAAPPAAEVKPKAKSAPAAAVEDTPPPAKKKAAKPATAPAPKAVPKAAAAPLEPVPAVGASVAPSVGARSGSLTVPTTAEARAEINRTPGAVEVVPSSAYAGSSPGATVKDAFDYVPGVLIRPHEGDLSNHFSIRSSGLSRNGDIRGVKFLMDGVIPLSRATGDTSFEDLDPSMFRYIEVYKGSNALQYGANSLGGAVNFVSPTGYDTSLFGARYDFGSFGFSKWTATSGGVYGAADYFVSVSGMEEAGYRNHSDGDYLRGMMNVGYRFNPNAETRFYLSAAETDRASAGSLTRSDALTNPRQAFTRPGLSAPPPPLTVANGGNDNIEWNIRKTTESYQLANKTTLRLAPGTIVDFGGFYVDRKYHLPVFNVIDTDMTEQGGFLRITDDRQLFGFRNRLIAGVTGHNGEQTRRQYFNFLGNRGSLNANAIQTSNNRIFYAEDSFFALPTLAIVAGMEAVHAERRQTDRFLSDGNSTGEATFNFFTPKIGLVWDITPNAQAFANVARSGEAPTFSEITVNPTYTLTLVPQKATNFEVGTRGQTQNYNWQLAFYHSDIENEFQCITTTPNTGFCSQVNIPRSVHQGVEFGGGAALLSGLLETGPRSDQIWVNAAYTFSDFHFSDHRIYNDNELPGQPKHFLRAEMLYKHPSGVYLGPNIERAGSYFVDNYNTMTVDGYTLWGAKLGFDNGGRISAYVEGRNLTDQHYISSANVASFANGTSTLFYPGNGRAFYSGIQFRW